MFLTRVVHNKCQQVTQASHITLLKNKKSRNISKLRTCKVYTSYVMYALGKNCGSICTFKLPYHKTVGRPRTRWADVVQRDALQLLGIRGWGRRVANRDEWEASYEGGQGPERAVASEMDGWILQRYCTV